MRRLAFGFVMLVGLLSTSIASVVGQSGVRAVVVNEAANIRIVPAIGAEVITTVEAGYVFDVVTGRSPDNEWIRVDFNGSEGWVNLTPLVVLEGDINALPVADPRTIPYGGFDTPRAGLTSATSDITGRLAFSGVRVRAGPSTGYPVQANAPRFTVMPLLGRTLSNGWVQVNFEGTLGWVITGVLEVQNGRSILELPVDGIIADSLPISEPIAEDYLATLRLMLARVNLAQPSLDQIRAMWTDAALAGRVFCHSYPARPSDYNIPNPLMAAFYVPLFELSNLFNDAMFNVRKAIDLFIEACEQPGTQNPVGQATVIGALQTVALADQQFARLREMLTALIPPDVEPGPGECLFAFQNKVEILPVIQFGQIVTDEITPRRRATGYCIDLVAGQTIQVESLQLPNSNVGHLIVFSPFDNPTNFLALGSSGEPGYVQVGPLPILISGRYLIVTTDVVDNRDVPAQGQFALLVSIIPTNSGGAQILQFDPNTGQVVAVFQPFLEQQPGTGEVVTCPSLTFTCAQFTSCEQAQACYNAGNFALDANGDGVACELLCGF